MCVFVVVWRDDGSLECSHILFKALASAADGAPLRGSGRRLVTTCGTLYGAPSRLRDVISSLGCRITCRRGAFASPVRAAQTSLKSLKGVLRWRPVCTLDTFSLFHTHAGITAAVAQLIYSLISAALS